MATAEQRITLTVRLQNVIGGAPYGQPFANEAESLLQLIQSDGEAFGLVSVERDYLCGAINSIRAALRQKGKQGDANRQFAREDISRFSRVGNFLETTIRK